MWHHTQKIICIVSDVKISNLTLNKSGHTYWLNWYLGETINFSIILICVFDISGIIHYESLSLKQSVKHSAFKFSNVLYRAHVLKKIQIFGKRRVFCMMSVCLYTQSFWRSDFEWDTNTSIETCTVLAWLGPMWPFQQISLVEFYLELLEDI